MARRKKSRLSSFPENREPGYKPPNPWGEEAYREDARKRKAYNDHSNAQYWEDRANREKTDWWLFLGGVTVLSFLALKYVEK